MANGNAVPDLQSILANLARLGSQEQTASAEREMHVDRHSTPDLQTNIESNGLQPPTEKAGDPRLRPQSRSTASPKPMIDPATITTWQDGLRCVTKLAAQNVHFAASIRRVRLYFQSFFEINKNPLTFR